MRNVKKLALFVLMLALVSTAAVADIHYVNPGDSIQAAIDAADPGDEIEVAPATYYEAIDFIGKAVRLYSTGGPDVTTIDGTGHYHVVQCTNSEGPGTILEGFTITGGNATGTEDDEKCGGGMYNYGSSPTVTDCTFSYNNAYENGGGMGNAEGSSPTMTNCTFENNTAKRGGGMYNNNANPTVTNCVFSGNTANFHGGGMYNVVCSPTVTNCTFSGNTATGSGLDGQGGGMHNTVSSPTVTNCTFSGNHANSWGGGMYNNNARPTVTDCTFTGNTTDSLGGGMFNNNFANPTVTNCTFSGNTAIDYYGGGMGNENDSSPTVTNCTFTGNTAFTGGGMFNRSGCSPTVTNCTFSGNTASVKGGGMLNNFKSSPTVTNCILWDDSPDEIYNDASSPIVTYSDVQGGWAGTGNIDTDPLFADADGRLSLGSPCIDAGNDAAVPPGVTTDLDGNPRIKGVCVDMGAFELQETPEVTFSGWVWMESYNDFGYSYNEDDLLYFLSFGHVWFYNITIGQWLISKPMGWVFVDWPYLYVLDKNALVFVLPPESGFWVYHFRPHQWTVSPRIIP